MIVPLLAYHADDEISSWFWQIFAPLLVLAPLVAVGVGVVAAFRGRRQPPRQGRSRAVRWALGLAIASLPIALYAPLVVVAFPPVGLVPVAAAVLAVVALARHERARVIAFVVLALSGVAVAYAAASAGSCAATDACWH